MEKQIDKETVRVLGSIVRDELQKAVSTIAERAAQGGYGASATKMAIVAEVGRLAGILIPSATAHRTGQGWIDESTKRAISENIVELGKHVAETAARTMAMHARGEV